jgi:hypothetical protein
MMKKFRGIFEIIISLAVLLVLAELVARFFFGLGNPPLFEASLDYGYKFIPNQDIRRFGNRIFFNAQGLRSEPITFGPTAGTLRVLCIGDSMTYGSTLTDQDKTYPYQLQGMLNARSSTRFEVLNASAPSWSIENEEGYLLTHGIYNSQIVILQISMHDFYRKMGSHKAVGVLADFPNRKPLLALQEIFFRYLPKYLPGLKTGRRPEETGIPEEILKRNLMSLTRISDFVNARDSKFAVLFIAENDRSKTDVFLPSFEKEKLLQILKGRDITFIDSEEDFRNAEGANLFRGNVHPNPEGNKVIAQALAEFILSK